MSKISEMLANVAGDYITMGETFEDKKTTLILP